LSEVQTTKLTDAIVCRLPYAASGQYVVRDTVVPGFVVVVDRKAWTWTAQVELGVSPLSNGSIRTGR